MSDRRMLKYPLFPVLDGEFDEIVSIEAQPSLGVNHVAMQSGIVTLWSLVDLETSPVHRRFRIAGTGHWMEPVGNYLGTVLERAYVWHIFELFGE